MMKCSKNQKYEDVKRTVKSSFRDVSDLTEHLYCLSTFNPSIDNKGLTSTHVPKMIKEIQDSE